MKKLFYLFLPALIVLWSCNKENVNPETEENGKITDIDGNEYEAVKIGDFEIMSTSLVVTKLNDGTELANPGGNNKAWQENTTGAYSYYDNDKEKWGDYGVLYNWKAVESGKLCPQGWHVPTDEEWKQLEISLGMTRKDADFEGFRASGDVGEKLKEAGNNHWVAPNNATNESGFTALPAAFRPYSGDFSYIVAGHNAYFWTSTEEDEYQAFYRMLRHDLKSVVRRGMSKKDGAAVRCFKD